MAQQWVDITTIDNNTPFTAVRWKSGWNTGDCWFSEMSGLTTDNMGWTDGTSEYGWYSAHRANSNSYSCSFIHEGSGYWNEEGWVYQDHVKDCPRNESGYYDSAVIIDGITYYEIDFSLWSGATNPNLYAPYSQMPWNEGEVYVLAGTSDITGTTDSISANWLGGTDTTLEISANDDWTASSSEGWVSLSPDSGTTGTSAITITIAQNNTYSARTATITFSCNTDTFEVAISQSEKVEITGNTNIIKFKYTGGTDSVSIIAADDWSAATSSEWITFTPVMGNSGATTVSVTASTNNTGGNRTGTLVFDCNNQTFTLGVNQGTQFGGLHLGNIELENIYLGGDELEAMYLGTLPIFERGGGSYEDNIGFGSQMNSGTTVSWSARTVGVYYNLNDGESVTISDPTGGTTTLTGPFKGGVTPIYVPENVTEVLDPYVAQIRCDFSGNTAFTKTLFASVSPMNPAVKAGYKTTGASQSVRIVYDDNAYQYLSPQIFIDGVAAADVSSADGHYDGNGYWLFVKPGSHIITYYLGDNADTIGTQLRESEAWAIIGSTAITQAYDSAFRNCPKLEELQFPNLYTASTNMCVSCTSLTEIDLPLVVKVDNYAFQRCSGVTAITLPSVFDLGTQAITNTQATDIYAPNLKRIGSKGLQYNTALDPVSIDFSSIQGLGDNALRNTAIKEAHFGTWLTSWDYNVFNGCSSLTALTFDSDTQGLTSMPSVGDGMTSLPEIVFPDCIQTYCQNSMQYALLKDETSLSAVTFGTGATTFQGLVFGGNMPALTSITCKATTAPSILSGAFSAVTNNVGTLYVPQGSDYSIWEAELGPNWTVSDTL